MSAERASLFSFPIDLRQVVCTRDASLLKQGDVVVYTGDNRRRWIHEHEKHWLLRVTRTEGQNVYGVDVYPRDGFGPDDEFVVVDGQVDHHGVYVIEAADE